MKPLENKLNAINSYNSCTIWVKYICKEGIDVNGKPLKECLLPAPPYLLSIYPNLVLINIIILQLRMSSLRITHV